jgi:NitT/TauT family transport system substrate-binding protein
MNIQKKQTNISVVFWAIILTLALAACGAPSEAAAVPDKVNLQLNWVFQAQFAGFFVAERQGFYTAENLDVDIFPGGPTLNPLDKLVAKEADFALLTDAIQVLEAREAGQPVVAVAAIYQKNPNVWFSLAEKNIISPKDMIGRRIGVKPVGEIPYRILLAASGIDRAQVKNNEIVITEFTIRPLVEDEVDIMLGFALDEPLIAKRLGHKINIITLADQGVLLPSQILVVREDLLQANPDLVRRFVQATLKGWTVATSEPATGLKATLETDETLDVTHQTDMMEATIALVSPEKAPVGHMDDKMWQQIMQIALEQDLISAPLELNKAYTTQFLE